MLITDVRPGEKAIINNTNSCYDFVIRDIDGGVAASSATVDPWTHEQLQAVLDYLIVERLHSQDAYDYYLEHTEIDGTHRQVWIGSSEV